MVKHRLLQLLAFSVLCCAVVASFMYLELDFSPFLDSRSRDQMADYSGKFLHPDISAGHLSSLGQAAIETLAISLTGTLVAAVFGLLLALPASGRYGAWGKGLARFILNALRSIPELVWAALMVLAAGLGPNAGTLALTVHTCGVLGRLFAEALENTPPSAERALTLAGARPVSAFCYGTLPMVWPQLASYSLYRWENNIRMATVLGFVGAGGLGQQLYIHLSLFQESQAATVILAMLVLVIGVDSLSALVRRLWLRS